MFTAPALRGTDIVDVDFAGVLADNDIQQLCDHLTSVIGEHGSARVRVIYGEVSSVTAHAAWQDLKECEIPENIDRLAIVTDVPWVRSASKEATSFLRAEVKMYTSCEADDALAWLRE